jgi:hypothetical protein
VLSIVEVVPRITWSHVSPAIRPVDAWLAKTRPASAIELPIGWNETELTYLLASTHHHVPIFNGISGFDTPLHRTLSESAYDEKMLDLLARNGSPVVIVHPEAAERARGLIEAGRLRLIVRFADGDAVYAIERSTSTTRSTSPSSL